MNNFTKEELEIIICNLCVNPKTKDILTELESMINNYCDHENSWADVYCDDCKKALCWEIPARD